MTDPSLGSTVVGILLAGGQARRMGGGDKCLIKLAGRPLLSLAIERLKDQVGDLVLNANGDAGRFGAFGLPVISDVLPGSEGPLAGVLTGMEWVRDNIPEASHILTAPTDTPFLPLDLVARFQHAAAEEKAELVCAASNNRSHPVIGLWPVSLAAQLRSAMTDEGIRKIDLWTARYDLAVVDWPSRPHDPFFNINRPEDVTAGEAILDSPV